MTTPGGGDLGTARGKIVIDSKEARKGVEDAEASLEAFRSKQKKAASELKDDATTAAKVYGTAVVGGFALAVNAAKDFEQSLANVKAAGGKQAFDQMEAIRAKALQLGADTSFSSIEAANAMEVLIKAGLSVNDVLNGAADAAVALAAAEGVTIPEAAEIAAVAMTAFNLKAEQMPQIANKISQAASATKMDMKDFSYAMNQAGAVSKLVGLSFDDMTLAITAMGKAGIVGSDAGTSLKTMLMNLQPATGPQREEFERLGLTVDGVNNKFFTAEGRIRSMTEIAGVLAEATAGMSEQQKIASLEILFGSDAIRAAAIVSEQGAQGMRNLTAEMASQLSVAEKAKVKQDTLSGAMEKMKGSIETAAIQFGTAFIPIMRQVAGAIEKVADWFSKLSPETQQLIGWILLGSTALLGFGFVVAKVVSVVSNIATVLQIGRAASGFVAGMKTIGAAATMTALQVRQAAVAFGTWAASAARATASVVASAATATASAVRTWAIMAAGWVRAAAVAMFNALIMAAAWLIANPWALIIAGIIALVAIIIANWDTIKDWLLGAWNWIKETAAKVWGAIKQFFIDWWPLILGIFTGGIGLIVGLIIKNWDAIKQFFVDVWTSIKNFFVDTWNAIVDAVVTAATAVWETIRSALAGALGSVIGWITETVVWFQGLPGKILDALRGAGEWLYGVGRDLIQGLINGAKAVAGKIFDAVVGPIKDAINGAKRLLGIASPSKVTYEMGEDTSAGFTNALNDRAAEVAGAMRAMMEGGVAIAATTTAPLTSAGAAGAPLPQALPAAGNTTVFNIDTLTVPVDAVVDPTNPAQWRRFIGAVQTGLRSYEGSYR